MKIQYIKQLLFICSVVITSSIYAQEFQQLNIQTQLAKQCHQDDEDIFSPQTYQLRSTKVVLKTYSCTSKKQDREQYYSAYGIQLGAKKSLYLVDQQVDASGYVGVKSEQVDADTIVFDSMYERGGDLVIVWMPDLQQIYHVKVHYMASDEGGIKLYRKNDQIFIQKIDLKALKHDQPIYKNIGKPVILKKVQGKGIVFASGDLKALQN
ncbi:hypothetical protein [Acinetobacter sp. CE-15]|uniref:hypothetical protein n=1 Tax=Acinetobacter sp. CE-15 TaxID=3425693 RepID=UPI003DA56495